MVTSSRSTLYTVSSFNAGSSAAIKLQPSAMPGTAFYRLVAIC